MQFETFESILTWEFLFIFNLVSILIGSRFSCILIVEVAFWELFVI